MKLIFDAEDCVIGIFFGALLIAMSERWFKLAYVKPALLVVSVLLLIVIVIDIIHEFSNLGRHFIFVGLSILHNLFDIVLILGLFAVSLNFSLPLLGHFTPYLADKAILFWLGVFEVVSHVVWLAMMPFNN
jgi:hypothetical protein